MKKIILTIFVFVTTTIVFSQNIYNDVVYLKTGNVIRGVIIEQIPNVSLKIETAYGSLFVFKFEEIEKITKENPPVKQTQSKTSAPQKKATVSPPAKKAPAPPSAKKEMGYFNKVMKSKDYKIRVKYIELIVNEELLYQIASAYGNRDSWTSATAVKRMKNEELLCKIALEIASLREMASEKVFKEDLLFKIAEKSIAVKDNKSYSKIIPRMTNQELLYQLIKDVKDENTGILILQRISDIEILKNIVNSSLMTELRVGALKKINDQPFLYEIAISENNRRLSSAALEKLNEEMLQKIVTLKTDNSSMQLEAIRKITDQQFLYKIMYDEKFNEQLRTSAFNKITDQELLLLIAQEDKNWETRRTAFNKLDTTTLEKVAAGVAKDKALAVAANIILKKTNWNKEFSNKSSEYLGRVIGAAAIVNTSKPESRDVVAACHTYIRKGDASRIPELIFLLDNYGNVTLAEDYMNCGQPTLSDAGCAWGRRHGYTCTTGYGSSRVRWGSGR